MAAPNEIYKDALNLKPTEKAELIDKLSIVSRKDVYELPGAREELNLIMGWLEDAGIEI